MNAKNNHKDEALIESEEKYRFLFENMAQGAFYQRADGLLVDVNQAALEMLDLTRDQFLGRTSYHPEWKVVRPDGSELLPDEHASMVALRTGQAVQKVIGVYRPISKDYVWLVADAIPHFKQGEERPYQVFVTLHDITARKRMEETLQHSEAVLRSYIDHAPYGVFVTNRDGVYVDVNLEAEIITGCSRDELIGMHVSRLVVPEDQHIARESFAILIRTGTIDVDTRFVRKDGRVGHWNVLAVKITEDRFLGFVQDITERRLAEQALRDSEQRYATLFSQMLDGYAIHEMIFDENGTPQDYRFLEINPAFEHLTKLSRDVIGRTVREVLPGIESHWIDTYGKVVQTGKPARFTSFSGEVGKWFEVLAFASQENQFVTIFQDITERQQTEIALQESQERFNRAMEATQDGLFDWNLVTNEIYYSPGWKRMLGYDYDELPNDFSIWETLTDPDDVERSWQMQQKLVRREIDRFEMEFKMRHKDGHWVDVLSRANAIFDAEDTAIRIVGTHVDITERKHAEDALRDSEAKYRQLIETASDAIYMISSDGRILETNQTACTMLDRQREEIIGMTISGVDPNFPVLEFQEFWKATPYNEQRIFETTHQKRDGTLIPIEISGQKFAVGDQQLYYGIARDMTARKEAESELREREAFLNAIFENSLNAIMVADDAGHYISVNQAAAEMFGYSIEELLQMKVGDLRTVFEPGASERYERYLKTGQDIGEFDFIHNITGVPHIAQYSAVRVAENFHLSILSDITDRKQAEEALRMQGAQLQEAQEFAGIGSWSFDVQSQQPTWTEQMFRLFGIDPAAGAPSYEKHKQYFHPDDWERFDQAVQSTSQTGIGYNLELRLVQPSGRIIWVNTRCETKFQDGKVVELFGTTQDITERKLAEQVLKEKMDELQRWYDVMLDREDRVLELKGEVNELLRRLGEPVRYPSTEVT